MEDRKNSFLRNIPNLISMFRIVLVAVFIYMFIETKYISCLIVYGVAFVSDLLDGYLARKNGWITSVGKLLDPFADKLMLITALFCFTVKGWIPLWVSLVVLIKETLLCVFGTVLYLKKVVVEADSGGKIATGLWTCAVIITILKGFYGKLELMAAIIVSCALAASILASLNYAIRYLFKPRKADAA